MRLDYHYSFTRGPKNNGFRFSETLMSLLDNTRMMDDSIIINLFNNSTTQKYFCSYCNTRLVPLTQEDKKGGYLCIKCTIEYWPNQTPVKKADRFDLPGPATDEHGNITGDRNIPIVMIDDPNKELSSTSYKQQKLPAAYEALKKSGFNFKSYEER
jgi:hypothetical protein